MHNNLSFCTKHNLVTGYQSNFCQVRETNHIVLNVDVLNNLL